MRNTPQRHSLTLRGPRPGHLPRTFCGTAPVGREIAATVARRVAESTGQGCVVCLLSRDGRWLRPGGAHHTTPALRDALLAAASGTTRLTSAGFWRDVVVERRLLRLSLDAEAPRFTLIPPHGAGALMAAPLIARDRVLGGIAVVRFGTRAPFGDGDEALLHELAERSALAIDNDRLYRVARTERVRRARAEEAFRRNEQQLRALVENTPDMICRFDRKLRYVYVNPAAERFSGMPASAFLGKSGHELGGRDPLMACEWTLRQVVSTGQEQTIEFALPTHAGERRYEARIAPEFGPDGAVGGAVSVVRDVTHQWRPEQEGPLRDHEMTEWLRRLQGLSERCAEMLERVHRLQEHSERSIAEREARLRVAGEMVPLTRREQEVVRLLARGLTNPQIGLSLHLTAGTVKNHVSSLLAKLGVDHRTQAAMRAAELGLLADDQPGHPLVP